MALFCEIACRILNIPCSEIEVEGLFAYLSFMIDPTANRMKDDLINSEMVIRMNEVFNHLNEFNGNFKFQLQKSYDLRINYSFPNLEILNAEKNK